MDNLEQINTAISILKKGGIAIFPTDTAFGIGCRVDRKESVKKLFEVRRRPHDKAVPVLVGSIEMAKKYITTISHDVEELMSQYWPGGLTIILECKKELIPDLVRGGGSTIGLRMPNHETTLSLINEIGVPILGPSANFAGEKTPYQVSDLDPELIKKVDILVTGECSIKQASTVIDTTVYPWKILRQGAVSLEL